MNVARDFDDERQEFGAEAIREALNASRWPWPDALPVAIPGAGEGALNLSATPFTWRDPKSIPRRDFLYGFELRRKQASAVVGVGAGGKTTFKVGRALCMASWSRT